MIGVILLVLLTKQILKDIILSHILMQELELKYREGEGVILSCGWLKA